MKKFTNGLVAGTIIAMAICGCSKSKDDAGTAVEMKVKWEVGKRYTNHMSMGQISHMEVPGMPNAVDQATIMTQDFTVSALKAMPDGSTAMAMDFLGEKMESRLGPKVLASFDTNEDPQNDKTNSIAPLMRKIVGAHFEYDMDSAGKATNIKGMDEFLASLPDGDAQGKAMIKSTMNNDLVQQFAMRGQGLPKTPVKIGDHWTTQLNENAGPVGVLQMDMNYTFTGWEDHGGHKCALVNFTGSMISKPGTDTNSGPLNISMEKGTITGKQWFDPDLGMVVDTTGDQDMTLKIVAQGKTINSQMKQNVSIRLDGVGNLAK